MNGKWRLARMLWMAAVLAGVLALTVSWGRAGGEDWPQWRGPNRDGTTQESAWRATALADGPKVVWRKDVGVGYSAVSIKGKFLYTMGNVGNRDIVYGLDVATGAELWQHSYECGTGSYAGPRATPVVDGGLVYTLSRDGHVFCLDATTGAVRWQKHLRTDLKVGLPTWGLAASPWVEGDRVLLNAGVHGIALNKLTGATVWSSAPGTGGYAAPVVYRQGGKSCVAVFGAQAIYGVALKTGQQLWSYTWVTKHNVNAADPIVRDGKVFITSGYQKGCVLLDISGDAPQVVWQNNAMQSHFSSVVYLAGYLYGIDGNTGGGALRCLDFKTGAEAWSQNLGFGSLIAAGGKLVVLNERGVLIIADAVPTGFREHSRAQVLQGGKSWTAPVLCRGMIYARNDKGALVCVDMR